MNFRIFNTIDYTTKTDEALVADIIEGNEKAFTEIYKRYSQKLYRYFMRMLDNDKEQAEDFLQELFLKLMHHSNRFNQNQKFSTWFYTIATNLCKNHWRNQSNRNRLLDGFENWNSDNLKSLDDRMEEKLFYKNFELVIEQFREEERELLLLKFQQELPTKEIAEILKIPEGTVKSRLFYLVKKLTNKLQHYSPQLN